MAAPAAAHQGAVTVLPHQQLKPPPKELVPFLCLKSWQSPAVGCRQPCPHSKVRVSTHSGVGPGGHPAMGWPYAPYSTGEAAALIRSASCSVRRGAAWRGAAWRGVAWRGAACRGVAYRFEDIDRVALEVRSVPPVYLDGELACLG